MNFERIYLPRADAPMKRILSSSELSVLEAGLAAALRRAFAAPRHIDAFDELLAKLN